MKKYDLILSNENIFKTFRENLINRNECLFAFIELLLTIEESYSIAIDGSWGSGKSFFAKQLEMVLLETNSYIKSEYNDNHDEIIELIPQRIKSNLENALFLPIYYDAWKNDGDEDPVLSLIYTIIQNVDISDNLKETNVSLEKLTKEIIQKFVPVEIDKILENTDVLSEINSKKNAEKQIKDFINNILPERGSKLVIIIDELDRCSPIYAVKMLERIKHYFVNDDIIFVFSINISELQHTVENVYGHGFDSGRYLDRFFDLKISLPYVGKTKHLPDLNQSGWMSDIVKAIGVELNLQMRELCKYHIYIDFLNKKTDTLSSGCYANPPMIFILFALLPIAYAYKITDIKLYNDFIRGKYPDLLFDIFEKNTDFTDFCSEALLGRGETFLPKIEDQKTVTKKSRLSEMYKNICQNKSTEFNANIQIGKITLEGKHIKFFKTMLTMLDS